MSNSYNDGSQHFKPRQVRVVNGVAIEESDVIVHTFGVGDADDPDLIAGLSINDWSRSEAGIWVMANCVEPPYWIRRINTANYFSYQYSIVARLTKQNETYFKLKFK